MILGNIKLKLDFLKVAKPTVQKVNSSHSKIEE